jgi:uncharacterized protein YbjT (DUF2867 family)
MTTCELNVVTGAFSFTGRFIARRLLARGEGVRTLTGHPGRARLFEGAVPAAPYRFDDPGALTASLEGATTLYNTYWIRFERGETTFEGAVGNTGALLQAAQRAGVRRIVHISIARADAGSSLPYFRAKGKAETLVRESGLAYTILRPTVLFGDEAILINNIGWMLRKFPFFAVPGSGEYRLQPVYVDDVAKMAVSAARADSGAIIHAAGPDIFSFNELIRLIGKYIGHSPRLMHVRPQRALQLTQMLGGLVEDVILTRDEVDGLSRNLLQAEGPATGCTPLGPWLEEHAETLGQSYFSELKRHFLD